MEVSKVLFYLIDNYGKRNGVSRKNFVARISQEQLVDREIAAKWLTPEARDIREGNRKKLAAFFERALPNIKADWFKSKTVDELKELIRAQGNHDIWIRLPLHKPLGAEAEADADEMQQLMAGYWTMYRFAFEGSGKVSKELLHIWRNGAETAFRNYYRVTRDSEKGVLWHADGTLVSLPHMYGLFGVQTSPGSDLPRLRVMFLRREAMNVNKNRRRFGILMGLDPDGMEPSAGRTLLVRTEKPVAGMPDAAFAEQHAVYLDAQEFVASMGTNGDKALRIISNLIKNPAQVFTLRTYTSHFIELMREPIPEMLNPGGADETDGDF